MKRAVLAFLGLVRVVYALHLRRFRDSPWDLVEVPLHRTPEGWYVAEVTLDGSSRRLVIDTGSPWLWSYRADNTMNQTQEGSDEQESLTPFQVQYCNVRVEGMVTNQSLSLPGKLNASPNLCMVGRATAGDEFWLRQKSIDGVAGLACGTADAGQQKQSEGSSLQVSLGCFMAAASRGSFNLQMTGSGGTLSFGPPPFELLTGLVDMPPSLLCGNWRAPVQAFVGRDSTLKPIGDAADAILDSGAPGINGPLEDIVSLARALNLEMQIHDSGSSSFTAPCDRELPPITFSLGSPGGRQAKVTIEGADLLKNAGSGGNCTVLLIGTESMQWTLGMPFFRRVRGVVFDPDARRVSIAP